MMPALDGLLAPDDVLPQRDRLLDPHAVAWRLAEASGMSKVSRCELLRTDYRFGRRLRVLHRERIGSRWRWVVGRAYPEGQSEEAFRQAVATATPTPTRGQHRNVVHARALGAVFWTFPSDRKLIRLARELHELRALARRLGGPGSGARVVGYKPEKSVVVELHDRRGRRLAYAKIYKEGLGERARGIHTWLARQVSPDHPRLRLATPLVSTAAAEPLVLEAITGRRIADLGGREACSGVARLGAALADFHSLTPPKGSSRFNRYDPERLAAAAELLAQACPRVAREARTLVDELGRVEPSREPLACLHGDVHPKNGLLAGTRVALIDLDKTSRGDAAVDLGSFLSLLSYERVLDRLAPADERARRRSFLEGYARVGSLPGPHTLRWHTAAALLAEQAMRTVRQIRTDALPRLDRLLADARRLLEGRDDG
ncbi:MAG: hypothetical protein E6J81_12350 [Deltaproteobacteria bacterium]|nr:MAG: hypothetical protein E6J81_12350 [Deltaproteobacteria bacterium]